MDATEEFAIGSLTVIELTGKDRNKILNNLCTQDLRSLSTGQLKETFILDVKGRTLSHGVVACLDSKTLFISSHGQSHRLVPHIDRYIIREDAVVQDVSDSYQAFLLTPDSSWASQYANHLLSGSECSSMQSEESDLICLSVRWLGPGTMLLLARGAPQNTPIDELLLKATPSDCKQRSGWEMRRIHNFWPWYGADIDEKNLPQEIAIDSRAISFHKGCYLGQETVARLDALGQVQKQLALVELQVGPDWQFQSPTELVVEGKSIGWLTSASKNDLPKGDMASWVGLAMLKRGHFEPGQEWSLDGGGLLKVSKQP